MNERVAAVERFFKTEVGPRAARLDEFPAAPPPVAVGDLLAGLGIPGIRDGASGDLPPPEVVEMLWAASGHCAGVAAHAAYAIAARMVVSRLGLPLEAAPIALALHEDRELFPGEARIDVAAHVEEDGRVTGAKRAVPLAPCAGAILVLARREVGLCLAMVKLGAGVAVGPPIGHLGLRAVQAADVTLQSAPIAACAAIPERNLLHPLGVLALLTAACAGGTAAAALEAASRYAEERVQGGRSIARHEPVALMLERNRSALRSARAAMLEVAQRLSTGDPRSWSACIRTKISTSQVAIDATFDAVQVMGGYGYMRDHGLEKRLRDAVTLGLVPLDRQRLALVCADADRLGLAP